MDEKKTIYQRLAEVQGKLKAPKGQYNSFGKYSYRSCEDIVEAAKPLCLEAGLVLRLSDEAVQIGERYYIKAEASVTDVASGESYSTFAMAREEDTKKGMDGSQITGAASSYARKYALNGLFAIDDTRDADSGGPESVADAGRDKGRQTAQGAAQPTRRSPAPRCERCGKEITPVQGTDGKMYDVDAVIGFSIRDFKNRTYCAACQTELRKAGKK